VNNLLPPELIRPLIANGSYTLRDWAGTYNDDNPVWFEVWTSADQNFNYNPENPDTKIYYSWCRNAKKQLSFLRKIPVINFSIAKSAPGLIYLTRTASTARFFKRGACAS